MIAIENIEVYGWEAAIRGMRNPMNSWDKSDTLFGCYPSEIAQHLLGENDYELMMKLVKGGSCHAKFRRMITVTMDITAPLYWWKEFDTYKVGTVRNSCSTMHKIQAKEFELDDFSHEHLLPPSREQLFTTVTIMNVYREQYLETQDKEMWWQMIQLLPSSYNQRATVQLNYEVLANMYKWRKDHKLDEWREFCREIKEQLPYSELFTEEDADG